MIILYVVSILFVFYLIYKYDHKWILRHTFTKKSFQSYQKEIEFYGYRYSFKQHIMVIFGICIFVIVLTYIFSLNVQSCLILCVVTVFMLPILILWQFQYMSYEREFYYLINYLQQFIALFKSNPKVLFTLKETVKTLEYELLSLVKECISIIETKGNIVEGLQHFEQAYPHFIICNLHTLAIAVELYGSDAYTEGLDLIQDDVDDWLEDCFEFKQKQIQLKNKVILMCGISTGIAYLAKQMLMEVDLTLHSWMYQGSMFCFFLSIIITIFMVYRIYSQPWIEKGEQVCSTL